MKSKVIKCEEVKYAEFPDLLTGTDEEGNRYADMSRFIEKKGKTGEHNEKMFQMHFFFWINAFCKAYGMDREDAVIREELTGHMLVAEPLELLLIAYVDSDFGMYMLERMEELFLNGFVLSDSRILSLVQTRFNANQLHELLNGQRN